MHDKERYFTGLEQVQNGFYILPKPLFDEHYNGLSLEAKFLYVVVKDLMGWSSQNGWIDAHDRLYVMMSLPKMAEKVGCSIRKANQLKQELIEHELLESVTPKVGGPSRLYVLKVQVPGYETHAEFAHEPMQNLHTTHAEFAHEPMQNLHSINTNYINTNNINTNKSIDSTAVGGENNRQTTLIGTELSQSVGRPIGWSGIQSYLESQNLALSPKQIGEIEDFMEIDGLEKSLIEKAIDITAGETGSKRSYNYLKGILTNWKNGNIKTVADHEANEADREKIPKRIFKSKRLQEKWDNYDDSNDLF